jgi:glycosyltransferase involved in cell wall biosynthesis
MLYKAGSAADLAAAVEKLISKPLPSNRAARAEYYRSRFSAQSVAAAYADLFKP